MTPFRQGPMLVRPTQDDWVFSFRLQHRRTGGIAWRHVGVTGRTPFDEARQQAVWNVNPPRATKEGRSPKILDLKWCHWHEWVMQPEYHPQPWHASILDTTKV